MSSQNNGLSQLKLNMLVSAAHELSAGIGNLVRVTESERAFERLTLAITQICPELEALVVLAQLIYLSDDNQFREQRYHELLLEFRGVVAEVIAITGSIVELSVDSNVPDILKPVNALAQHARELDLDFAQHSFNHL